MNTHLNRHISNLKLLVENLNLSNITLVVHDWGGAIGMGLATAYPHLIKKMVIMNTAAFRSIEIPTRINILRNPFGEWFIRSFNGFAGPCNFYGNEQRTLSSDKKRFHTSLFMTFKLRIATAKFVQDIPMSKNHPTYKVLKDNRRKTSIHSKPCFTPLG